MKTIIRILLFVVVVTLTFMIYKSIKHPIDFEKNRKERYNVTIERLKDIRTAQLAYKDVYGKFTGSWDTLIYFVINDSIRNVHRVGELTDSMIEANINENKAVELGLIVRDTVKESVLESLFGESYDATKLRYVPVPDANIEFHLAASTLYMASGARVPVFEVKAHNNTILKNLDEQLIINLNDQRRTNEKYPGLQVGSLTEANNNAGNWESMSEFGTALDIKDPLLIENISLPIESSTDSILFRLILYQIDGDSIFTPLHRDPFYVPIVPSQESKTYTMDVSSVPVVARPGKILVAIEQVDAYEKGVSVGIPVYFGKPFYRRNIFHPHFKRIDMIKFSLGFQVYGRVLPE